MKNTNSATETNAGWTKITPVLTCDICGGYSSNIVKVTMKGNVLLICAECNGHN